MPTKSAIAGMCCAALGHDRGGEAEQHFLASFNEITMTALVIPHERCMQEISVRRLVDYHTVGGGYDPTKDSERNHITVAAEDGKPRTKNGQALAVLTHRSYLLDASFGVLLEGDITLLKHLAEALADPVWGLWLGRKTCIPSAPVLVGLFGTRDEALYSLVGKRSLSSFTRQQDAATFAEGGDSLPDKALSFASSARRFAPRRIQTMQRSDGG
jgi:CRISPR system Cascade subunit CasD